ncbi:MAG: DUF1552 domain-containing protein [Bradymonadaceae bacterium]|nr:DUF1552 domain-containing protein [Lujinxingiaceae bacterium]
MNRRTFLRGSAGVVMALPFLEGLIHANPAYANNKPPVYFVCLRSGNGVQQATSNEPERFWPFERGQLTKQMLQRVDAQGDMRAVGELADHADKLLIVDGTRYTFPGNGCGHSGGGNQCLTATPPSEYPAVNRSLATGESIDYLIERKMNPNNPEPLTLLGGFTSSYLNEVLSYAPPLPGETNARLRAAERNPWEVYKSLFGHPDDTRDDLLYNQVVTQRKSVNDLLREQFESLRRKTALSTADRSRLDLHQNSIRELEERMLACHLPETDWKSIEATGASGEWRDANRAQQMLYMMMDITALAFSCDLKRAATLQIGNGNDHTTYETTGSRFQFHWISHRIQSDGAEGAAIENAAHKHHQIDRIHARWFKYLIERLEEYQVLDDTVALWTNDLANGIAHGYSNLPMVIAGSGGGYLKQGVYVDARATGTTASGGFVPHNQLFNTILNAVGVRKDDGSLIDDFGHKGGLNHNKPAGGEIPGIKA